MGTEALLCESPAVAVVQPHACAGNEGMPLTKRAWQAWRSVWPVVSSPHDGAAVFCAAVSC